jgi:hypothetical protein
VIDLVEELVGWLRARDSLVVLLTKDTKNVPHIHPDVLPQGAGFNANAIVIHQVSGSTEMHLGGASEVGHMTLQFDCLSTVPKTARKIRGQLKTELLVNLFRGVVGTVNVRGIEPGTETDSRDEPIDGSATYRYVRTIDFNFAYKAL